MSTRESSPGPEPRAPDALPDTPTDPLPDLDAGPAAGEALRGGADKVDDNVRQQAAVRAAQRQLEE